MKAKDTLPLPGTPLAGPDSEFAIRGAIIYIAQAENEDVLRGVDAFKSATVLLGHGCLQPTLNASEFLLYQIKPLAIGRLLSDESRLRETASQNGDEQCGRLNLCFPHMSITL